MTWREAGVGNLTGEFLFDAEEGERGREINGDPPGSYTKGKEKLFLSFTLTVFLWRPPPVKCLSLPSSLTFALSHQLFCVNGIKK